MNDEELLNGIDALTGEPLPPAMDDEEILRDPRDTVLDEARFHEYQWFLENFSDPERRPTEGVDPADLGSAGWGVIWAPDLGDDVKAALEPLLEHRRKQATRRFEHYFRAYEYRGQTKQEFLSEQGTSWGAADPEKVPYYLLLVGDPRKLPFEFQYDLDIQYAVGRIHFDATGDYAKYAESVVASETAAAAAPVPRPAVFFGVETKDDQTSQRTMAEMLRPLVAALSKEQTDGFEIRLEEKADRGRFRDLLSGEQVPALLFAAAHGMRFPPNDRRQLAHQGALVCADWPGRSARPEGVPREHYFAGEDVPDADLRGLIACLFACFSAGTPERDNFSKAALGRPQPVASYPFVSSLAQRLLRQGALAVLGHIDRAWTTSFTWSEKAGDQTKIFHSTLSRLLHGHSVGFAMEYVNSRYTELSVELSNLFIAQRERRSPSKDLLRRVRKARNDARNFIVIGDPAARLAGIW